MSNFFVFFVLKVVLRILEMIKCLLLYDGCFHKWWYNAIVAPFVKSCFKKSILNDDYYYFYYSSLPYTTYRWHYCPEHAHARLCVCTYLETSLIIMNARQKMLLKSAFFSFFLSLGVSRLIDGFFSATAAQVFSTCVRQKVKFEYNNSLAGEG